MMGRGFRKAIWGGGVSGRRFFREGTGNISQDMYTNERAGDTVVDAAQVFSCLRCSNPSR